MGQQSGSPGAGSGATGDDAGAGYPGAWEIDTLLADGTGVHLRPVRPADAPRLIEFHAHLSPETIHRRFFAARPELDEQEAARLTTVDYADRMAFVAEARTRIVAVARYDRAPGTSTAELAVVVTDELQGRGVGTVLIEQLAAYARSRSIERFVAETLPENHAMLAVFDDLGFVVERATHDGAVDVTIELATTPRYLAARDERERRAIARSLRPLLEPESIAVVGASRRAGSAGHEILRSLLAFDFTGRVYPVNPAARSICGVPTYPDVASVPEPVDLAVVAVPGPAVLDVVRQCAETGVGSLAVVSSGFAETGADGRRLELETLEVTRRHGIRLLGPNCLGLVSTAPDVQMNASFSPVGPTVGNVALASQSGAVGVMLLERIADADLGVSAFVSMGNKADVSSNDLLCAWEDDPRTAVIALYLESFGNPRKFARIARRVARKKPVVALKSGTSVAGARGARSHSAAAATPEVAVEELLRSSGVIHANGLDELVDVVTLCASSPMPAGRRVVLVGNSGGPLVLAADACEHAGLVVPELAAATADELLSIMPPASAATNPIDMTSGGDQACLVAVLRRALADPAVDAAIAVVTPLNALSEQQARDAIAEVAADATKPVVACMVGGRLVPEHAPRQAPGTGRSSSAIGTIPSPERAASALAHLARYAEWLARPETTPEVLDLDPAAARAIVAEELTREPAGGWLAGGTAWRLVGTSGVAAAPTAVAHDIESLRLAAAGIGYPVALKSGAASLVHKSDVGGVVLGIEDPDALARAYEAMRAGLGEQAEDVLVQKMLPAGTEVIVGMSSDPLFGPLVVVGLGGVATDLLADHAFGVPPITHDQALEMLRSLRGAPLLTGYRGSRPVDLDALADVVCRVSALSELCPEIVELDCNPVVASPTGAVVVDAKVRLEPRPDAPDQLTRMLRRPVVPGHEHD
jgi:acyl-CoA synthetase (NDP forming)/RimJ/RimL family protein N-acetyltransferase